MRRRNGIWIRRAVRIFGIGTEKKCISCSGPGLTFRKIGGITVDMELHVTSMVPDNGIWMGGTIIQEMCDSQGSCLGAFGLG